MSIKMVPLGAKLKHFGKTNTKTKHQSYNLIKVHISFRFKCLFMFVRVLALSKSNVSGPQKIYPE